MKFTHDWPEVTVPTLDLKLDPENARIDLRANASQQEIREALIEAEEVLELATSISKGGGRMAGERIVVIKSEKGDYIVIEGNRRTCACQLLLNPSLVAKGWRVPAVDENTKRAIQNLKADLAPSRQEADIIVTRRHTEKGIKPWSTLANIRRIERMIASNKSLTDIATEAGISQGRVNKLHKAAKLLQKVQSLKIWSEAEKKRISDPKLKTTSFTRFFELSGVSEKLGISIDKTGELVSALPSAEFDQALAYLAKKLLIPNPITGKTELNTRSQPETVFATMAKENPNLTKLAPKKGSKPGKAPKFYEGLQCGAIDARIQYIAEEISKIPYAVYKNAAAFLFAWV